MRACSAMAGTGFRELDADSARAIERWQQWFEGLSAGLYATNLGALAGGGSGRGDAASHAAGHRAVSRRAGCRSGCIGQRGWFAGAARAGAGKPPATAEPCASGGAACAGVDRCAGAGLRTRILDCLDSRGRLSAAHRASGSACRRQPGAGLGMAYRTLCPGRCRQPAFTPQQQLSSACRAAAIDPAGQWHGAGRFAQPAQGAYRSRASAQLVVVRRT